MRERKGKGDWEITGNNCAFLTSVCLRGVRTSVCTCARSRTSVCVYLSQCQSVCARACLCWRMCLCPCLCLCLCLCVLMCMSLYQLVCVRGGGVALEGSRPRHLLQGEIRLFCVCAYLQIYPRLHHTTDLYASCGPSRVRKSLHRVHAT